MQTLTAALIVAFFARAHADGISGTDSDLIASAQGICIDMGDYGRNGLWSEQMPRPAIPFGFPLPAIRPTGVGLGR